MAEYRIWGRIERLADGFRAVASAMPDGPATGPRAEDVRAHQEPSLSSCRVMLGRLVYDLSAAVMKRGDQVVWLDVR